MLAAQVHPLVAIDFNSGKGTKVRIIWRIMPPTKIIQGTREIRVLHMLAAQVHPLVVVIPRFIQLKVPLPPLKPMAPASELPHAVIEPLVLRAAKAPSVE
jgi:hypothetical protein